MDKPSPLFTDGHTTIAGDTSHILGRVLRRGCASRGPQAHLFEARYLWPLQACVTG